MEPAITRSPVHLTLGAAALHLSPSEVRLTRGFNGAVPGPTIRTAPGEALRVTLSNGLVGGPPAPSVPLNAFQHFNVTGLHTHGLHISPRPPADDVFATVPPGASRTYLFDVPRDHMGGTHWYHPHVHGAAAMQVGGGALGMLIVDDPPGALPPSVADLSEIHLVIADLRAQSLHNLGARQEAACHAAGGASCAEAFWTPTAALGLPEALLLVNGRANPTFALRASQWHRLRLLFGSNGGGAASARGGARMMGMMMGRRLGMMSGGGAGGSDWSGADLRPRLAGCEVSLLAKDGVYLPRAPRPIAFGYMAAGNRADWLVRCPVGTHALTDDESGATLATFVATASAAPPAPPIAPFAVGRPCYLADLLDVAPNVTHAIALEHMAFEMRTDGVSAAFAGADASAMTLPVGAVAALSIGGTSTMDHVFHMHVNPFQLAEETPAHTREVAGNYFERGDWHDTIRRPAGGGMMAAMNAAPIRVRFQTDRFTGVVPMHCHYLVHEDQGMLATLRIDGVEGAMFPAAALRPLGSCYRGGTPLPWAALPAYSVARTAADGAAPLHSSWPRAWWGGGVALVGAAAALRKAAWAGTAHRMH